MVSPSAYPASRYRRRILGLGALATGALYVIGAPIFTDRIESDLETRVPIELAELGYRGVTAEFSGQDGTLTCERPLDDPEAARGAAFDVRGVRTVDLERSCRVLTVADPIESDEAAESSDDALDDEATADSSLEASDDIADVSADSAPTTEATTPTTEASLATISEVVAADPNLRFLSVLLAEAPAPSADQPVTLFAPSNEAFDALPAEVAARLQNDAEFRAVFLAHHTVAGTLLSTDLVDGPIPALDGSELNVVTGDVNMIDGSSLIDVDIAASNGVVHVVDRVLVSDALDLPGDGESAAAAATWANSTITLTGVVASEVERNVLLTAAVDATGVGNVIDETTVDPDIGLDADTASRLATLTAAMPANLLSGEAGFDGNALYARGVFLSGDARDAYTAAATSVDVEAALEPPPAASEDDAVDLEAQLNTFVAENPILFEPSSAVLSASAFAVIDRIAADVQGFAGIAITVEGHTDSDGAPAANLQLSQGRADAVRTALIERGLTAESIEAVGFGSEQPILVDGVENKDDSRRVEFRVVTTS